MCFYVVIAVPDARHTEWTRAQSFILDVAIEEEYITIIINSHSFNG